MTPAKTAPKLVILTLLALAVNGTMPAVLPGFVLPTTVPRVVAPPIGLFATPPAGGVGVAGTTAGAPAVRTTFEPPVAPGAAGTVWKPAAGTVTCVMRTELQLLDTGAWTCPSGI